MSLTWSLRCDHCKTAFYSGNATHNLRPMWAAAGCEDQFYEWEGRKADEALPFLRAGVAAMEADPDKFRALNPPNGLGDYDGALEWLWRAVAACVKHPNAVIHIHA